MFNEWKYLFQKLNIHYIILTIFIVIAIIILLNLVSANVCLCQKLYNHSTDNDEYVNWTKDEICIQMDDSYIWTLDSSDSDISTDEFGY